MIGQEKLFEKLITSNLPKSNLIIGECGCGKHTFVNKICEKHKLDCVDITENVSKELIDEIYISSKISAYIIDIVELSKKSRYINKENAILKFIEEPPQGAVIFVLAEYESQVIDTIKNRCIIWKFEPYHINDLKQFKQFNNKQIYSLLNTPGKVINSDDEQYYESLFNTCDNIINNIHKANISNTLSLEKHLAFNNDKGYTLQLFFNAMKLKLYDRIYQNSSNEDLYAFYLTLQDIRKLQVLNVNEKNLFDNYILGLKTIYDRT